MLVLFSILILLFCYARPYFPHKEKDKTMMILKHDQCKNNDTNSHEADMVEADP